MTGSRCLRVHLASPRPRRRSSARSRNSSRCRGRKWHGKASKRREPHGSPPNIIRLALKFTRTNMSHATATAKPIDYPDSDGEPIAENTLQFEWIVTIKGGLDALFVDDPDVFVAGDLLWYPVEGEPKIRQAPGILVAFGRRKGYRGCYKQWEEGDI